MHRCNCVLAVFTLLVKEQAGAVCDATKA